MSITDRDRALFEAAAFRNDKIHALHQSGREDATLLHKTLVGKRCVKFGRIFEITSIDYSYDGYITAHGYRILGNGKRGTKIWDIGVITSRSFE